MKLSRVQTRPNPHILIKYKTTLPNVVLIKKAEPRNKSMKHLYVKNQE